jgi:hypothetical protein
MEWALGDMREFSTPYANFIAHTLPETLCSLTGTVDIHAHWQGLDGDDVLTVDYEVTAQFGDIDVRLAVGAGHHLEPDYELEVDGRRLFNATVDELDEPTVEHIKQRLVAEARYRPTAQTLAETTYLSDKEAFVHQLALDGFDTTAIAGLIEATHGEVSTLLQRASTKRAKAQREHERAEATLDYFDQLDDVV